MQTIYIGEKAYTKLFLLSQITGLILGFEVEGSPFINNKKTISLIYLKFNGIDGGHHVVELIFFFFLIFTQHGLAAGPYIKNKKIIFLIYPFQDGF